MKKRTYPNGDNGNDNEKEQGGEVGEGGEKKREEVINSFVARECKLKPL